MRLISLLEAQIVRNGSMVLLPLGCTRTLSSARIPHLHHPSQPQAKTYRSAFLTTVVLPAGSPQDRNGPLLALTLPRPDPPCLYPLSPARHLPSESRLRRLHSGALSEQASQIVVSPACALPNHYRVSGRRRAATPSDWPSRAVIATLISLNCRASSTTRTSSFSSPDLAILSLSSSESYFQCC
jgi:hypothetical protein